MLLFIFQCNFPVFLPLFLYSFFFLLSSSVSQYVVLYPSIPSLSIHSSPSAKSLPGSARQAVQTNQVRDLPREIHVCERVKSKRKVRVERQASREAGRHEGRKEMRVVASQVGGEATRRLRKGRKW
ncbi:hypothetical protein E2C01_060528 [Portunus trituberculatus]|uniref:Uncharacterized protein n=1 Tax=Portunus trituberculatus TaxID=210409 RepID=A0A5B7H1E7_PORTR|nr:hypothetical protein [Portunus trituberculatus]